MERKITEMRGKLTWPVFSTRCFHVRLVEQESRPLLSFAIVVLIKEQFFSACHFQIT
jgi:hypothetical protein